MTDWRRAARGAASAPKRVSIGFWRGWTYPFKGMAFVYFRHPGLVRIWIVPIVLTAASMGLMIWGAWELHEVAVTSWWPEPTGEGVWPAVAGFFHGLLEAVAFVVLLFAGLLLVVAFTSVIAAPFNDALSERVECLVTGSDPPPFRLGRFVKDQLRTVGLEVTKALLYALFVLPLWPLSLFSGPAALVYSVLAFVFSALYFAIDYVDWPAARRDWPIGQRLRWVLGRFAPMFGFGVAVWVFLFVPLVNLLFMPAAVAGGTLLYLDLEGEAPAPAELVRPV